jgi:hypothetical protein
MMTPMTSTEHKLEHGGTPAQSPWSTVPPWKGDGSQTHLWGVPTLYKGTRMRSATEARFAGFMDRRGFRWEYEPDDFEDERGHYRPDFVVYSQGEPDLKIYVEIKPTLEQGHEAINKMEIIHSSFDELHRPGLMVFVPIGPRPRGFEQVAWWGAPCRVCGGIEDVVWQLRDLDGNELPRETCKVCLGLKGTPHVMTSPPDHMGFVARQRQKAA